MSRTLWVGLALALFASTLIAQGGPPLSTEDCGTPGAGWIEAIVATELARQRDGTETASAFFDLTIGLGDRAQASVTVPLEMLHDESLIAGPGRVDLLAKYRWLGDAAGDFSVSNSVVLSFLPETRSQERGLADAGVDLRFAMQAQGTLFDSISLGGEIGLTRSDQNPTAWDAGLALSWSPHAAVELAAELQMGGSLESSAVDLTLVVGSRISLGENLSLLVSAERGLGGDSPEARGLLGIQWRF